jgi:hypothetical protein
MLISVNKFNSSRQILTEVSAGYRDNLNKIDSSYSSGIIALPISIFHQQLAAKTGYGVP